MQSRTIANAPRPSVDTIANASADRAVVAGVAGAPRRVENAMQLREVTVTGASPSAKSFAESSGVEGCYQLRSDSASSAVSAGFPARFALVNASAGAPYVVRSVSPEGRIDSIVPGSSWRRLTPELVSVSFANAVERHSLTLQFAAGVVTGRANVENQIANLPVTRIECRP